MVEAAGVESSQNFVLVRDHAHSFVFVGARLFTTRTTMHHHEHFLSRPVPSSKGGGGVEPPQRSMVPMDLVSKNF
jgi:hypothetical protein